jgi:hypothetical protein
MIQRLVLSSIVFATLALLSMDPMHSASLALLAALTFVRV